MADPRFFKTSAPVSLAGIAAKCEVELADAADGDFLVKDIATLDSASGTQLAFLDNHKYVSQFKVTKAGACIIHPDFKDLAPKGVRLLLSKSPYKSYALASALLNPDLKPDTGISNKAEIHPSAKIGANATIESFVIIDENAEIGDNAWIAAYTYIGPGVKIGNNCRIMQSVTITHSLIGDSVKIYTGARIGQEGFGFAIDRAGFVKVPQLGRVIIEGYSEIGANTTIDRGALGDTVIGMGTWLDNLIQIAHNVKIGKGCIMAAGVGISGSCEIGDYVMLGGHVGVVGHLKIGTLAKVAAKSGVTRDIPPKEEWMGYPAMPMKQFLRHTAYLNRVTKKNKGTKKHDN